MEELKWAWPASAIATLVILIAIGGLINGRFVGILIDSRSKMSLSRFQLFLWTWLFVSSFFAIMLAKKTLNIEMAPELWALMGISLGSTAGAVIVKGTKEARTPDAGKVDQSTMDLPRRGLLVRNKVPGEASLLDMFKGEEITEHDYVDISKVQMFFFTIAAWLGFVLVLWSTKLVMNNAGALVFPALSPSLVTMIGISHVGYLTVKSAPKTPSN